MGESVGKLETRADSITSDLCGFGIGRMASAASSFGN